jgi:hypothetical protein
MFERVQLQNSNAIVLNQFLQYRNEMIEILLSLFDYPSWALARLMPQNSGVDMNRTMTRRWTWSSKFRLQNGNRSRCLADLAETNSPSFIDMAEAAAQPALQQVGRPLSLIPVGLYVQ